MGIVEELGEGVTLLKKGDRVVMPFNVADGRCRNCEEGKTAFCTGVNPGFAGGAYGMTSMISTIFIYLSNTARLRCHGSIPWWYGATVHSFWPPRKAKRVAGQAQYIRIPYADFNALKLPPGKEFESDFILLAG